jgi:signal transduction histidine kinase
MYDCTQIPKISVGDDRISTTEMNKSLKESDRRVDPNIIDSAQSSHLKEVNNQLITKHNKQREFVSLAAHELRSPILPILGTLELIEYEFEESGKKEVTLKIEHFERLVRNVKRLERLASEILDVTKIDDQSLRLNREYFNLKELVLDLVDDHKRELQKSNSSTKLLYEFKIEEEEEIPTRQDDFSPDIFINADKIRINQVLDKPIN